MKKFFIEHAKEYNGHPFPRSYLAEKFYIYPWTQGRFIIKLNMVGNSVYDGRRVISDASLNRLNLTRQQFFLVGDELTPILNRQDQIHNYNPRLATINLQRDDDNNLYFFHVNSQVGVPPLFPIKENQKGTIFVEGNERPYYKKYGKALVSITPNRINYCHFLQSIFVPEKIEHNQVLQLDFHSETSYTYKVMELTEKNKNIVGVCISDDGLKGCALIQDHNDPWEVVVWDLE